MRCITGLWFLGLCGLLPRPLLTKHIGYDDFEDVERLRGGPIAPRLVEYKGETRTTRGMLDRVK